MKLARWNWLIFLLLLMPMVFSYVGCPGSSKVEIAARADDEYWLSFVNRENIQYTVPFAEVAGNSIRYGRDNTRNFITEEVSGFDALLASPTPDDAFNIVRKDTFLVTGGGLIGSSHVLEYTGAEPSNQVLTFQDLALGPLSVPFTFVDENQTYGRFQLTVGGFTFTGFVWAADSSKGPYPISVDLDASGSIDGGVAPVIIRGGGILDIGANDGSGNGVVGNIQASLTTPQRSFRDNKGDESLEFTISNRNSRVSVGNVRYFRNGVQRTSTSIPAFDLYQDDATKNYYGATDYGVLINYYRPTATAEELIIDYPGLGPCVVQRPEPVIVQPPIIRPPIQPIQPPIVVPVRPIEQPTVQSPVETPTEEKPIEQPGEKQPEPMQETVPAAPVQKTPSPSTWSRFWSWLFGWFR